MKIVYNQRYATLQTYDQACVTYLEGLGHTVICLTDDVVGDYNFVTNGISLLIVGPPGTSTTTTHAAATFLQALELPIISMCAYSSRYYFEMGTAHGASTTSTFTVLDTTHPIAKGLPTTAITVGTSVSCQRLSANTTGTNVVIRTNVATSAMGVGEKFVTINDADYSRIHWGYHRWDTLNADGKDIFSGILDYVQLPIAETVFEGEAPFVKGSVIKIPTLAEFSVSGDAPTFDVDGIFLGLKFVFNYRTSLLQYDQDFIAFMERHSAEVVALSDAELPWYDYSGVSLVIIGQSTTDAHARDSFVRNLKLPIIVLDRGVARFTFGMGNTMTTSARSTFTVVDTNHFITAGLSGAVVIGASVTNTGLAALTSGTNLIMHYGAAGYAGICERFTTEKGNYGQKRIFFGYYQVGSLNYTGYDLLRRVVIYALMTSTPMGNVDFTGEVPEICGHHRIIKPPLRETKIVYCKRPTETTEQGFVDHLRNHGYTVDVISEANAETYDYSDIDLFILGAPGTTASFPTNLYFLQFLELPILTMCRLSATSVYGFSMAPSSGTRSTASYVRKVNLNHPIAQKTPDSTTYISGETTTHAYLATPVYEGTDFIFSNLNTGQVLLSEVFVEISAVNYPRLFWGFYNSDTYNDSGFRFYQTIINYLVDFVGEVSVEGLAPDINHISWVPQARSTIEGLSPTLATNAALLNPSTLDISVENFVPSVWTKKYGLVYLPADALDYCWFRSTYPERVWISDIMIKNQNDDTLLEVGPYDYHPDGWRINTNYIIKCQPGDILTIFVTRTHSWSSTGYNIRLYWGHSIFTADLVLVDLLDSGTGVYPRTYQYEWTVPDEPGVHLVSWAARNGTMSSLCGEHSFSERQDYTLWIGTPPINTPYYIFMGGVASGRKEKALLPMLGGFIDEEIETGIVEDRLSGGMLVSDIKTPRKRFTITFENMLVSHFNQWAAQQALQTIREVEVMNRDMTTSTYIVRFVGDHGHIRLKTNKDQWLYGQVSFILQEV